MHRCGQSDANPLQNPSDSHRIDDGSFLPVFLPVELVAILACQPLPETLQAATPRLLTKATDVHTEGQCTKTV